MTRLSVRLLAVLAALVLLGGNVVRADMIDFGYSWEVKPTAIIPGGTGAVTLAASPDSTSQATLGSSVPMLIPGASVTTSSSATDGVDSFDTMFSMVLSLTDAASSQTGKLTFSGKLSGTLSATQSTLVTTFDTPVMRSITLGENTYSVTIDPALVNLPSPGAPNPAQINALVTVNTDDGNNGGGGGGGPIQTPEPSSLVLGGAAFAIMGAVARRRKRTAA